MRYRNLNDYIRQRCQAFDIPITDASLKMGFSRGYLSSIAKGAFTPSKEKCLKIARFFDDPPTTVLQLAGFYIPEEDVQQHEEIARLAAALPRDEQRLLHEVAVLLKERVDRRKKKGNS